jgi:hypothetical protein
VSKHLAAAIIAGVLVFSAIPQGQQQTTPAPSQATQGGGRAGRPPAPPETTVATATGAASDVFATEARLDKAILQGDVATVKETIAHDFIAALDDRWTTDGTSRMVDREQFLSSLAKRPFAVHDVDRQRIEMHPEVAITYGRHVDLRNDQPATSGQLVSTWFQRVYALRAGNWQLLSERAIHGPTPSPAGVDPTASDDSPSYGIGPVWFVNAPAPPPPTPKSADEKELAGIDQVIATAVVNGQTDYVRSRTTPDFSMVHGDIWTRGGKASLRDTQESMLNRVTNKSYGVLDFDHIRVERHDDVAITTGRYLARSNGARPERAWFSVWFERVYQKRDGHWVYLSHRTVHGPTYGPDRESVETK